METERSGERALSYVQALIERTRVSGEGRLPTIGEMAHRAGVAHMTMWRAVDRLRRQGVLTAKPGAGVRLAADMPATAHLPASPPRSPATARKAWRRIREQLRSDILRQGWQPGTRLPTAKELSATHGVDYRTLRKALAGLVAEGVLESYGRGYRVAGTARGSVSGDIVLIAQGDRNRVMQFFSTRSSADLITLNSLCGNSGASLRVVTLSTREFRRPFASRDDIKEVRANTNALGYIVWLAGIFPDRVDSLLDLLARTGKPVALLDETGYASRVPLRNESMRYFLYGYGPTPGLVVGRYLAGMGHRRIAFLSPYHDADWSRTRLDALRLAFERAGLPRAVTPFVDERPSPMDIGDESVREEKRLLDDLLVAAPSQPGLQTRTAASVLREMTLRKIGAVWEEAVRIRVEALTAAVLADRTLTAVACANDVAAAHCLRTLRAARVRVPNDMSVVGFDDSFHALTNSITSYSFNGHSVMNAMVQHVLHPTARSREQRPAAEIEGRVHERGSCCGRSRLDI